MGVADQTAVEDMAQVLVYTSEVLTEPLMVAGNVRAELWVATDAPSADYVARLCVVDGCGSWNIAEGITRVPVGGTSVAGPGEPFPVTVSLRSIAARIDAGKRLRLHVTSGSSPMWSTNPQTGAPPELTAPTEGRAAVHAVYHDAGRPSRLVLPEVVA
jgi:putative CocE/NonD family hydrolase